MIVRMDFEDTGIAAVRTTYKGKAKNHYIRFVVDEYSVDKAIQRIKGNKYVVALDYVGDYQHLFDITERPSVPIIVTKSLKDINELSISFFMKSIPDWVIVSIKTPADFSDMRVIEQLSLKFSNIRFCGGKFLRLPNCRIGCIQREDLPRAVPDSKIKTYTEGCACVITSMNFEDLEDREILYKDKFNVADVMDKEKAEEKKKRIIGNIEDLLNL